MPLSRRAFHEGQPSYTNLADLSDDRLDSVGMVVPVGAVPGTPLYPTAFYLTEKIRGPRLRGGPKAHLTLGVVRPCFPHLPLRPVLRTERQMHFFVGKKKRKTRNQGVA
jgi:hypothetical protein